MNKLENVQLEAARNVSGSTKFISLDRLYDEMGQEKLSKMMENFHNLFHKVQNTRTPEYLQKVIPGMIQKRHSYNTCKTQNVI